MLGRALVSKSYISGVSWLNDRASNKTTSCNSQVCVECPRNVQIQVGSSKYSWESQEVGQSMHLCPVKRLSAFFVAQESLQEENQKLKILETVMIDQLSRFGIMHNASLLEWVLLAFSQACYMWSSTERLSVNTYLSNNFQKRNCSFTTQHKVRFRIMAHTWCIIVLIHLLLRVRTAGTPTENLLAKKVQFGARLLSRYTIILSIISYVFYTF
jgi:hypothetical protein